MRVHAFSSLTVEMQDQQRLKTGQMHGPPEIRISGHVELQGL